MHVLSEEERARIRDRVALMSREEAGLRFEQNGQEVKELIRQEPALQNEAVNLKRYREHEGWAKEAAATKDAHLRAAYANPDAARRALAAREQQVGRAETLRELEQQPEKFGALQREKGLFGRLKGDEAARDHACAAARAGGEMERRAANMKSLYREPPSPDRDTQAAGALKRHEVQHAVLNEEARQIKARFPDLTQRYEPSRAGGLGLEVGGRGGLDR